MQQREIDGGGVGAYLAHEVDPQEVGPHRLLRPGVAAERFDDLDPTTRDVRIPALVDPVERITLWPLLRPQDRQPAGPTPTLLILRILGQPVVDPPLLGAAQHPRP